MKLFAVLLLAASPVGASHGPHQHLSPRTKEAMSEVESACSRDVVKYCTEDELDVDPVSDLLKSVGITPMVRGEPAGEPDLPSILDQMIFMSLQMPMEMPQQEFYYTIVEQPTFHLRVYDEPQADRMETPRDPSEHLLDKMVSSLAEEPHIDPIDLSKTILQKGHAVMDAEGSDEDDRRLARRLTEVHGRQGRTPLPFGCSKNRCLRSAFEQGIVSDECADSMQVADRVYRADHTVALIEHQKGAFFGFSLLYFVLTLCTIIVLHSRLRKHFKKIHEHRRLAESILIAVYNDPAIKAKVEDSVQQDLGYVPPLPPHVLARAHKPPTGHKVLLAFKLVVVVVVIVLACTDPLLAMMILCGYMLLRCLMVSMGWCLPSMPKDDCTCCCCGMSTEDLRLGKPLTKAQACCTCCNSTGVCPPTCKLCCGFDPDGGCNCCQDGCDCCSPKDVCTCCCCGLDTIHVRMGEITVEQACCTCCNGTGTCPETCKACCGTDGSCGCCEDVCDCCSPKDDCTCCCCGLDSSHAKIGVMTEDQACCSCCKGSGSCPPSCQDCCGVDPDGSCDCCADGCDCCSPSDKTEVYEAVSIQIV